MLKCSLRQCKNTDACAENFLVVTKILAKRFAVLAIWPFWVRNSLQPLPDNVFCCGSKAHNDSTLKATNSSANEKPKWDADEPNGPDTEPNLCLFY
jgi:hypothetical protein